VQVRRDDDGRGVGLELARRHGVLRLLGRLLLGSRLVGVPLGHMRQLGWVGVHAGGIVLLRVVVRGVGVVVDGRVRLRGEVVVVVRVLVLMLVGELMLVRQRVCVGVVGLAARLMVGRHMGAGHSDVY
jgi:hypothetical protein